MILPHHSMVTRSKNNVFKINVGFYLFVKSSTPFPVEPSSVAQAMKVPDWRHAMSEEYNALIRNGTWKLVPPTEHQNLAGCE